MGMTEKDSLINAVTLLLVEDYSLPIKEVKAKLTEMLQGYHVTLSDESYKGNNLDTEYLLKKFSDGKKAVGMKESTIKQYIIAIQKLEGITEKKIKDIEAEDINNFLVSYSKKVSSVTLRGKYQLISSVYNWLFQHKYIPFNPMLYVDAPKATVIYKNPLSDLDLEKIKKVCENMDSKESVRDMAIVHFLVSTGCRISEMCNVKMKDIDLDNKICKVMGKGNKERPVVLSDKAVYRLQLYLAQRKDLSDYSPLFAHIRGEESKMTKDGIGRIIQKIRNETGINKLTCHVFRRYYATELRKHNVNVQMIATSLGHANLNQINRYSLYDSKEMLNNIRQAL